MRSCQVPRVKHKIKIHNDEDEDEEQLDDDIRAALEQACVELGYFEEDIYYYYIVVRLFIGTQRIR